LTCLVCGAASSIRFCSYPCLEAYSRGRQGVECAVCQWDPETGRVGNANTHRLCGECSSAEENADWCEPSDYEQTAEDVDVTTAAAGGQRLEAIAGRRRKVDTALATRVIRAARRRIPRRRRRRNAKGDLLRGWVTVEEGPSLREIAKEAGCSPEYARKVMRQLLADET
jgi:hypothetical protein